jgi:hypothetical protein
VGKNLVVAKEQTKTAKVMLKEWEQGVSPQMIVHHASVVAIAKANLIYLWPGAQAAWLRPSQKPRSKAEGAS